MGFLSGARGKEPASKCRKPKRRRFDSPGREDPLEENMATHSSILTWRIPWTQEPVRLQSTGLQRVRHDWGNLAGHAHTSKSYLCCPPSPLLTGTAMLSWWHPGSPSPDCLMLGSSAAGLPCPTSNLKPHRTTFPASRFTRPTSHC